MNVANALLGDFSSICFNEFNPVVDGNVLRLLSRYYGLKTPIDSLKAQRKIKEIGQKLINKTNLILHKKETA